MNLLPVLLIALLFSVLSALGFPQVEEKISKISQVASILLAIQTPEELKDSYNKIANSSGNSKKTPEPIKILIVPGHEPDFGGTRFGDLWERDMVVDLADDLVSYFSTNSNYEAVVSRSKEEWNPIFQEYFDSEWVEIKEFVEEQKKETAELVRQGKIPESSDPNRHNAVSNDVAYRLYGLNKWANENGVDITIHIHFNDYPRSNMTVAGKHSGFAIYVPEGEFVNGEVARAVADNVYKRLASRYPPSDLPKEVGGLIEEQELIALGSYNTSESASMLVEYAYIYEPIFREKEIRDLVIDDLAFQTYLGVQDFFGAGNDVTLSFNTTLLPHTFSKDISASTKPSKESLILQEALFQAGVYPTSRTKLGLSESMRDCPRTGRVGPCTLSAISLFQKEQGIVGEKDLVGPKTRSALNQFFSSDFLK